VFVLCGSFCSDINFRVFHFLKRTKRLGLGIALDSEAGIFFYLPTLALGRHAARMGYLK